MPRHETADPPLRRGRLLFVLLLVSGGALTNCAGGDGNSDDAGGPSVQARATLRDVEPDLERLSSSVVAAKASKRATLVEVQAAATRAAQSLSDARRELRDLADMENIDASTRRQLREQISAVRDLRDLCDSLAVPTLSAPRIEAASARAKLAIADLDSSIDVPAIAADVLAADLRDVRARKEAKRAPQTAGAPQTGRPSAPVGGGSSSGGASFDYTLYRGPAFEARIPTGAGWGTPSASEPTPGQLFRTNVRGPNGLFVIIDYTPLESAKFGSGFRSRTVVGQTAFGAAVRYEFQGGRIAECQRQSCVDYIINGTGSGGFAVLAGGGAGSVDVARTVAESVVPVGE